MVRVVYMDRIMFQFRLIFTKILSQKKSLNKQKVKDVVEMINLLLFVAIITHFMACVFLYIGAISPKHWIELNGFNKDDPFALYVFAFYWIIETLTTVGYGDYNGKEMEEIVFTMILEFIGLTFFSFLTGTVTIIAGKKETFTELVNERLDTLDVWIKQIERSNQPKFLPAWMYSSIRKFVEDAFRYDYNMIIEEVEEIWPSLSPALQAEIIDDIFHDFKKRFSTFFEQTESGFRNEFIISLYCRVYPKDSLLVGYKDKFREMYFITSGGVRF